MFIKSSDGLSIYYDFIKRKNPAVVLLHGLAGSGESFKQVINGLRNHSIISIDLRGHGKSSKPKGLDYYTLDKVTRDVKEVLVKEKIKSFYLVGFSVGGNIALRLKNDFRNIKKIILINPALGKDYVKPSFIIKVLLSRFLPNFILKPFIKSYDISTYKGLLDEYAKLLINTPSYVTWSYLVNMLNSNELIPSSDDVIITSDKDEILKNKNYAYKIKGHHYIIAENPKDVSAVLTQLMIP